MVETSAPDPEAAKAGDGMGRTNWAVGGSGNGGHRPEDAECFGWLQENASDFVHAVDRAEELEALQHKLMGRLTAMSRVGLALKNGRGSGTHHQPTAKREELVKALDEEYIRAVVLLARTMQARDGYPDDHGDHLAILAERIAQRFGLPEEQVAEIRWAARLHDIGKVGVPGAVLSKPGPLTDQEWTLMRNHPATGENILLPVKRMRGVGNIIRHHQERWDGTGYPDGLREESIPLGARILAVTIAYCAMTSARPYQGQKTSVEAESELDRQAGAQFDPNVVEALTRIEVLDPRTGVWTELSEAMKKIPQAVLATA